MQVQAERTTKKLAKHAARLVKRHGAEVATSLLVSLVSSAATVLLERAQRKAMKAAKKGKKGRKGHKHGKKHRRELAAVGA